jgi:hypothetical protein
MTLGGECVNNCSVFVEKSDCVEDHCFWEEEEGEEEEEGKEEKKGICRIKCNDIEDEEICLKESFGECFWVEKSGGETMTQCLYKVNII